MRRVFLLPLLLACTSLSRSERTEQGVETVIVERAPADPVEVETVAGKSTCQDAQDGQGTACGTVQAGSTQRKPGTARDPVR